MFHDINSKNNVEFYMKIVCGKSYKVYIIDVRVLDAPLGFS